MRGNGHGRLGKRAESEEPGGEGAAKRDHRPQCNFHRIDLQTMSSKTLNI
jgi:hypothetical protein